jgi:putative phosphoesterase
VKKSKQFILNVGQMKILLLSDTHSTVDGRIEKYAATVDEIWHAGDIGSIDVISELEKFAPVIAVHGNIDHGEVKEKFPEFLHFHREGVTILMTHIAGKPGRYSKPLGEKLNNIQSPNLLVCGHSHILLVKHDKRSDLLWLNPGACGNHGFHRLKTMLRFDIENGKLKNMEVIEWTRK